MAKKIIIVLSSFALVAIGAVLFLYMTQQSTETITATATSNVTAAVSTDAAEIAQLRREVEELRALVNGLVGNEVPRISGQQAREIADEFMDVATTPRSAVLFLEDNRLMFEVDLRSESGTRYMIYINAVTGGVSRMSRFDDVAFAEPVAQPAQNVAAVPTPSPQPTPASTPSPTWSPSPTSSPSPTWSPSPSPSGSSSSGSRPQNTSISLTRAREIAEADLARRGISASFHSNSGMSWERGQWVWELEFRSGRRVIEYYINVDTGNIVKFEWDD